MVLRPSPCGTGPTEGREQPPKVPLTGQNVKPDEEDGHLDRTERVDDEPDAEDGGELQRHRLGRGGERGCGGARRALARNNVCASRYLLRLRAWLQTVRRTQTACLPVPDPRRRGRQRLQTGQSVPLYFSATNVAATIPTQAIEHYNFYIYRKSFSLLF